jgi:hypothetical protein
MTSEKERLEENRLGKRDWYRWGPYLSERQWGTVREDYSPGGTAWNYFSHDMARSRAYRWGEDGIGGLSDSGQQLCLSVALWNGQDPILKERLFGLTSSQGNHGEDVKECYYYLDATPTHSYLKMLYKYPQGSFPYTRLVQENAQRGRDQMEFELIDTGIFDQDRYFDVFVEYAKAGPDDILMRITVHNRGPQEATLHLLPQILFRNTWSWNDSAKPRIRKKKKNHITLSHAELGNYQFYLEGAAEILFCENETNVPRLWGGSEQGYFKDAFHDYVVFGQKEAVCPKSSGTKAAAAYCFSIEAGGSESVRLRLTPETLSAPFRGFDRQFEQRQQEADEFYGELQSQIADEDQRRIQRQALAGMIWCKQYYGYDVERWLVGDPAEPSPPAERLQGRNSQWQHVYCNDVLSMPDAWEYPWFAAWDLAFHCVALALIDAEFAKNQLILLTRDRYIHPDGQLPAYEWAFGDVNPPVHAWAAWRVFQMDRRQRGDAEGDIEFLKRVFNKLVLNFTWWVNCKDSGGHNVFQGGFLGLDNIDVFDRSAPLPTGGKITQADGTAWMAMYCLNLMRIAMELAQHESLYEDMATKFFEHFLYIAEAMTDIGGVELWDAEDEFFFDVLDLPDGRRVPLKIDSIVGLIPLFAVETLDEELIKKLPNFNRRMKWFLEHRPKLASLVSHWNIPGVGNRKLLSLLRGHRMKCVIQKIVDETMFLSDYGVRALSQRLRDKPYVFDYAGQRLTIDYEPGESTTALFGGNSNWRGPIWFPINFLLIESLQKFHHYYGDDFKIECPTGSNNKMNINQIAEEITRRLISIFQRDERGRRAVFGQYEKMQSDPHFQDYLWFHEYFHGDSGRGVGASHQTGWTGLVAKLIQPRRTDAPIKGRGRKGPNRLRQEKVS